MYVLLESEDSKVPGIGIKKLSASLLLCESLRNKISNVETLELLNFVCPERIKD